MLIRILIIVACNQAYFQNTDGTQTALMHWNTCRYDDEAYIAEELRKTRERTARRRRAALRRRRAAMNREIAAILRRNRLARCKRLRISCR